MQNDLDLWCDTPSGETIWFGGKSAGGGTLDVDMVNPPGVENIFFTDPVPGRYRFYVKNYRGSSATFTASLLNGDDFQERTFTSNSQEGTVPCTTRFCSLPSTPNS